MKITQMVFVFALMVASIGWGSGLATLQAQPVRVQIPEWKLRLALPEGWVWQRDASSSTAPVYQALGPDPTLQLEMWESLPGTQALYQAWQTEAEDLGLRSKGLRAYATGAWPGYQGEGTYTSPQGPRWGLLRLVHIDRRYVWTLLSAPATGQAEWQSTFRQIVDSLLPATP